MWSYPSSCCAPNAAIRSQDPASHHKPRRAIAGPVAAAGLRVALFIGGVALSAEPADAEGAPRLPEIRMHRHNGVPACVTTERLMAFLASRNQSLDPRYRDIAKWYRHHGEAWRVRWDYAFFQMALETNFLTYRRGNGKPGDVKPAQNNFAGIGATGGGVPGDRFADVGTGVLAQVQHLVAYSGELVPRPVAPRTASKQLDIISAVRQLKRPVRFSDLARRWAADPRYASSIASIADTFQRSYCRDDAAQAASPIRKHSAADEALPPVPHPAARARAHLVAKTLWRRGEPELPARTDVAAAATQAVTASQTAATEDQTSPSRLLGGLQAIAADVHARTADRPPEPPVVVPTPRLASRE